MGRYGRLRSSIQSRHRDLDGVPVKRALLVAALLLGGPIACGSDAWQTKATLNMDVAVQRIGDMSVEDRRLYAQGVQHILHQHQRIGSFTIGQVVDQERSRSQARADAKKQVVEHQYDAQRTNYLRNSLPDVEGPTDVWLGGAIDGNTCSLRVNADNYNDKSDQDKRMLEGYAREQCTKAYQGTSLPGNAHPWKLPKDGLDIEWFDLTDLPIHADRVMP